ncbi:MAG TPA: alpha/beta hydrolase, partial [Candidatus Acidoferrales bacterium]|nr:alpha/beta hydrolase [Candidatus Acidoferrales bacterium]
MTSTESVLHLDHLPLRSQYADIHGVRFHFIEAGNGDAMPVVLLHGFPEFWMGWRKQIPALVDAGFRVIVPDQRGYNLSDKPQGIDSYDLDALGLDVVGLADHLGIDKLRLVGHDWGASVAWWLATTQPARIEKMATLNAPHPALWRRAMRDNPAQRRKSWYVFMLRIPWLPELGLRASNFKSLAQSLVDSSRPGTFSVADFDAYRQAWAQPGALTAMINWYRALLRKEMPTDLPKVDFETLMIWGVDDKFGDRSVAEESIGLCNRGRIVCVDQTTHWVHH